jgi:hypothetical protein
VRDLPSVNRFVLPPVLTAHPPRISHSCLRSPLPAERGRLTIVREPLLSIPRLFLGDISRSRLPDYRLPIPVSETGQGSHFVWNMDNLWISRFPTLPSLYPMWGGDVGRLAGRALSRLSRGWKDLRFTLMISYGDSYVH